MLISNMHLVSGIAHEWHRSKREDRRGTKAPGQRPTPVVGTAAEGPMCELRPTGERRRCKLGLPALRRMRTDKPAFSIECRSGLCHGPSYGEPPGHNLTVAIPSHLRRILKTRIRVHRASRVLPADCDLARWYGIAAFPPKSTGRPARNATLAGSTAGMCTFRCSH